MMTDTNKAYLQLHASVFLWGFTAILGKLISISALPLVWWRMLITSLGLFIILRGFSTIKKIPKPVALRVMGIGIIVAIHWLGFYGSIKYANASIALVCLTTTSLFTTIAEFLFLKKPFNKIEVAIAIVIIPAMALIVNDLEIKMITGVLIGIFSALAAAIFSVLNKKMLSQIEPLPMTFLEIGAGFLFLSLVLPFYLYFNPTTPFMPSNMDWGYLLFLSFFCTILPYIMSLYALQKLTPFTTVLAINLEPVYGIFMAYWFLHEDKELPTSFYFGVSVILFAVFLHPLLKAKLKK
jgi:drug/metabolite transporter (DMT)-like permease